MTSLAVRGINYDAGVLYEGTFHSRPLWRLDDVRRDLTVIRDELSCNAVSIMATDKERLADAGQIAAELGLFVWLQPRLFDVSGEEVESNLCSAATVAEELRTSHGRVGLNVGCELTLSTSGMVPGGSFVRRGRLLPWFFWLKPVYDRRLDRLLRRLVAASRRHFGGPLTYGAGDWETIDWEHFDYVGLDTYRDGSNKGRYADDLRRHVRRGKPVLVVEFGCCSYEGAAERGPSGFEVLDWRRDPPTVPSRVTRNEQVQADYITESLDVFESTGVHGAFVWSFSEPRLTHSTNLPEDLDVASFGIVKVLPRESDDAGEPEHWEPKVAFDALADRYRSASADEAQSAMTGTPTPTPASSHRPRLATPWRIGIVFMAVTVAMIVLPSLVRGVFGLALDEYDRVAHAMRAVLVTIALCGIALAARRYLDRGPLSGMGLATRGAGRMVAVGAAAWLLPASLAAAGCVAVGWVHIELVIDPADLLAIVATQVLLVLLLEALPEEMVFRSYLFINLGERLGGWATILAQAALFAVWGLVIGSVDDPWSLLRFFAIGVGLGYLRAITGSIWPGVAFHVAFQTVAQLLIGAQVPVATVSNLAGLEVVAFGMLPFAVGLPLVERLLRTRPAWLHPRDHPEEPAAGD